MRRKNASERISPDKAGIARACAILAGGGLVAVPTETVYGLASRADSAAAVAGIYEAKGRPSFNPLIVHVASAGHAAQLSRFSKQAEALAENFWPGPLTMVLPRSDSGVLADAVSAGLDTLAIRVPAHSVMQAVLAESGLPLAAPSANRSEAVSPTTPDHVLETLDGHIDAVLDAGPCEQGLESTIVALRGSGGWELLRPGPIGRDAIADVLGPESASDTERIEAPGQLARHYSPGKPVRLNALEAETDEFLIGFGPVAGSITLSAEGNMAEAASRLYTCLHTAARSGHPRIAIAPVPDAGVGEAINDRLRRAAT